MAASGLRWAALALGAAVLAIGVVKTLVTQVLFADGSFYLLNIVGSRGFNYIPHRTFSVWVAQSPTVVAVRLFNVHSYHVLALILGFGTFIIPAALCAAAIYLARKWQGPLLFAVLSSAILFTMSSGGLLLEYSVATSLFIFGATVLLLPQRLTNIQLGLVLFVSVFSFNAYESYVVLAPILLVLTVLRQRRPDQRSPSWFAFTNCALLCLSTVANLYFLLAVGPDNGGRNSLIKDTLHPSKYAPEWRHAIVWTIGLFVLIGVLGAIGGRRRLGNLAYFGLAAVGVLLALSPLVLHTAITPAPGFKIRGDTVALVAACAVVLAVVLTLSPARHGAPSTRWGLFVALLLVAFALVNTLAVATGWSQYQRQFAHEVNTRPGSIDATSLAINPMLSDEFSWPWTNPTLGLVLQDQQGVTGVVNPPDAVPATGQLMTQIDAYAASPSLENMPPTLRDYHW